MDDNELQKAAMSAAFNSVGGLWFGSPPVINPNATLKSLSQHELGWIVNMAISTWICERGRQVSTVRGAEGLIRTLDSQTPEPWERGAVMAILPALADFVADNDLTNKPIGEWDRDAICLFVWMCFRLVEGARVARDETPDNIPFDPPRGAELLEAG